MPSGEWRMPMGKSCAAAPGKGRQRRDMDWRRRDQTSEGKRRRQGREGRASPLARRKARAAEAEMQQASDAVFFIIVSSTFKGRTGELAVFRAVFPSLIEREEANLRSAAGKTPIIIYFIHERPDSRKLRGIISGAQKEGFTL
jgi:hypothetical protein